MLAPQRPKYGSRLVWCFYKFISLLCSSCRDRWIPRRYLKPPLLLRSCRASHCQLIAETFKHRIQLQSASYPSFFSFLFKKIRLFVDRCVHRNKISVRSKERGLKEIDGGLFVCLLRKLFFFCVLGIVGVVVSFLFLGNGIDNLRIVVLLPFHLLCTWFVWDHI